MIDLVVALGLVLVLEGIFYALAPDKMKEFMKQALELPDQTLRIGGLCAMAVGFVVVWIARGGF